MSNRGKYFYWFSFVAFILVIIPFAVSGQKKIIRTSGKNELSVVVRNDGSRISGKVINKSLTTLLILTDSAGYMTIPNSEIKSVRSVSSQERFDRHKQVPGTFSSQYYITPNALPVKEGDANLLINFWGLGIKYGADRNFSMTISSTWALTPILASMKYSIPVTHDLHAGIGLMGGYLTWLQPEGFGLLPFGTLTFGNEDYNLNIGGGYGWYFQYKSHPETAPVYSISGLARLGKKTFLVAETIIYTRNEPFAFTLLLPGIRYSPFESVSVNFAFGGFFSEKTSGPIPLISLFLKLHKNDL